ATLAACSADESAPEATEAPTAQVDTTALGAHSLAVNSLPEMQLLATSSGREVLSRIVSCALPRGASITAINRNGTPYSFTGNQGLAPQWAQRAATSVEQHRVTACMLGRPAPTAPTAPVAAEINRA
ncbi:MAG TPA: hypothetical protein VLM79_02370, partial [Kofleriaceae bacterium]|nr:hypothetical protein [Kofleriaceae bacterium]